MNTLPNGPLIPGSGNFSSIEAGIIKIGYLIDKSSLIKFYANLATTTNIILQSLQNIDGVLTTEGDRILVKDQTNATENGIYVVTNDLWYRAYDFSNGIDVSGSYTFVTLGNINNDTLFVCTNDLKTGIIGINDIVFNLVSKGSSINPGGNNFDIQYFENDNVVGSDNFTFNNSNILSFGFNITGYQNSNGSSNGINITGGDCSNGVAGSVNIEGSVNLTGESLGGSLDLYSGYTTGVSGTRSNIILNPSIIFSSCDLYNTTSILSPILF